MREKYNGGLWTKARYQSFVKGSLRSASRRWPPKYQVLDDACVGRQVNELTGRLAKHFKCAKCCRNFPQKQIEVNHKTPVISLSGFTTWDDVIERLFCEKDGLEVLCKECHKSVTKSENEERKRLRNDDESEEVCG